MVSTVVTEDPIADLMRQKMFFSVGKIATFYNSDIKI